LTGFITCFTTERAFSKFILNHWIISRTGSSEFLSSNDVPDVDKQEGNPEYAENDKECGKK